MTFQSDADVSCQQGWIKNELELQIESDVRDLGHFLFDVCLCNLHCTFLVGSKSHYHGQTNIFPKQCKLMSF